MLAKIDKRALIKALLDDVEHALSVMVAAAESAHDAATHEEMKAENEKDTRAIEAGYLAKGQSARAAELERARAALKKLQPRACETVDEGALVRIREKGRRSTLFVAPAGGGLKVRVPVAVTVGDGCAAGSAPATLEISVVTPESPLGDALIGKEAGDVAEIEPDEGPGRRGPVREIDVEEVA